MMRRQVVKDAVQPSVVAPPVLEQEDLTVLLVRQRPQVAQESGRVRGRAEAHCLQNGVVAAGRRGRDRRFGWLGQESAVLVVWVELCGMFKSASTPSQSYGAWQAFAA